MSKVDFARYTDDNTPCYKNDVKEVINSLKEESELFYWFADERK